MKVYFSPCWCVCGLFIFFPFLLAFKCAYLCILMNSIIFYWTTYCTNFDEHYQFMVKSLDGCVLLHWLHVLFHIWSLVSEIKINLSYGGYYWSYCIPWLSLISILVYFGGKSIFFEMCLWYYIIVCFLNNRTWLIITGRNASEEEGWLRLNGAKYATSFSCPMGSIAKMSIGAQLDLYFLLLGIFLLFFLGCRFCM